MQFTCKADADGLHLHISAHEGAYPAWWREICAEIYGWSPQEKHVRVNGKEVSNAVLHSLPHGVSIVFADDGKGEELQLR
jgi:hypothetical protein